MPQSALTSGATPLEGLRAWAAADPDRTAISDRDTEITFGELLPRVESTAACAREALVSAPPDAYLPVLVDRSANSAVAMLACLAGRVRYLPIDASAPVALIERVLQRAGNPGCFLSGAATHGPIRGATRVDVDSSRSTNPRETEEPDGLGVVLFSSGSTGEPKGVVLSWATIERRWRYRAGLYGVRSGRRQPIVPPMDSFWAMNLISDVAMGLTARVADVGRDGLPDFLADMSRFAPSSVAIPAQLARLMAQLPHDELVRLPSVERVVIGSEGFRYEYVRKLREIFEPSATIVHNLASTEGGRTVGYSFRLDEAPEAGVIPVGRINFPNDTRLVPMDGHGSGVCEVHVGGAIASEYLGDPDLTAARFYVDEDGSRWWRSGDLVSQGTDGLFLHEGRLDDVVKIAGRLASPSDVTAVLMSLPGIRAAVTVPVVSGGSTRLVAHVEVEPGFEVTLDAVRSALAARLQPHAVPAAVVRHRRLPISARGKVDRRALADGPHELW